MLKGENHFFLFPIYNLEIEHQDNFQLEIGRVKFISIDSQSYKYKEEITQIRTQNGYKKFFDFSPTVAFIEFKKTHVDNYSKALKFVKESILILSHSKLSHVSRRYDCHFGITPIKKVYTSLSFSQNNEQIHFKAEQFPGFFKMKINSIWQENSKIFYFDKLLKIIYSEEYNIGKNWKRTLSKAVKLSGRSLLSNSIPESFLWNMIAIEILLTEQGDKVKDELPKRCEAFIGWVFDWESEKYHKSISDMYQKRCLLVHQGDLDIITQSDVKFTDNLIFNILWNLVEHIDYFPSKENVIKFSKKIHAEKLLGLESKIEPKSLKFSRTITNKHNPFKSQ